MNTMSNSQPFIVHQDDETTIIQIEELAHYAIPSRSDPEFRNVRLLANNGIFEFTCDCHYGFWGKRKTECWHIKQLKKVFPQLLKASTLVDLED